MATKIYVAPEASTTWDDSAGDLVCSLLNLAAGAGRIGARLDLGDASHADTFEWRCVIQMETAGVVGETIDLYLSTSDGTDEDGGVGTADAAYSANQEKNLMYIGSVIVDTTSTATDIVASGICNVSARYVSPVIINNTADNLENTSNACSFTLTPIPMESQ